MDVRSERRIVTCVFVDVVGSTDMMMRVGPEVMRRRLAEAFEQMSARIRGQGGTVENYVGDAIFALFGAPTAHVDDAERALRAAEACASWSSQALTTDRLAIRVGIETGEALIDLGAAERRDRMAVGAAVNTAARLQQQANPGEIVVGPSTHDATGAIANFEPLGPLQLKGLGEIEAWRFNGFSAPTETTTVPFVGREAELQLLAEAAEKAAEGTATLCLILGSPGLGKSRLAAEAIARRRQLAPLRCVEVRCRPGAEVGVNTPLRQLVEADVRDATESSVLGRMTELLGPEDGGTVATAINHSCGLASDERLMAVSRLEQRELIAAAWRRYLTALARVELLVLLVEDLHWADPVLVRVIDHVTSDVSAPILVVATARPEFAGSAHLGTAENRLEIDLTPLDATSSALLASAANPSFAGLERAAGNPLFIIELARSRSSGADLPMTIQAAIAARLDELALNERQLLQHASIAGEEFDVRDAAPLDDREPAEAAGMLGRIAHLGFVAPVGSKFRFHHALVRDVAYGRLPVAERIALHARYARQGVPVSDVEARAHHLWEAVGPAEASWVWEDVETLNSLRNSAYDAHMAAGARLEERNQYEQATVAYERAVMLASEPARLGAAEAALGRALARQGRGDESWEHRLLGVDAYRQSGKEPPAELYADMLEIATMNWGYFQKMPEQADISRLLEEGERNARAQGDDLSLARLLIERASYTGEVSMADEAVPYIQSVEAVRFADAAQRLAMLYVWDGQMTRGIELLRPVFDDLIPRGAAINYPEALVWYCVAAFHTGNLELAEDLVRIEQEDAAKGRSPHTRQHVLGVRSLLSFVRGDWDQLIATTQELEQLVDTNPQATFCLMGCFAIGSGSAARILRGQPLPHDLDAVAERLVPVSERVQASAMMLPKAMQGDVEAAERGLAGYSPGLLLWDRADTWDMSHLMPAIALTLQERWDELGPYLARLDACATTGSVLAGATAAAIREEQAAAEGGSPPEHESLRTLGFAGISELLRYRPDPGQIKRP